MNKPTRTLLLLLILLLSVTACATPQATEPIVAVPTATTVPQATTFTDPFAYCAEVGTIDEPDARFAGGDELPEAIRQGLLDLGLVSADAPPEILAGGVWRCREGKVVVCHVGANLPCLGKADSSETPSEPLKEFCAENTDADVVPAVVTGRETIYEWRCTDGAPEIGRAVFTVDDQGFISDFWYELPAEPGAAEPTAEASGETPTPVTSAEGETQPNGRLLMHSSQSADLDGDGTEEEIITSSWLDPKDNYAIPLQVDIVAADGTVLYSQNSWESLGDPGTSSPEELGLFSYDSIQSVDVQELAGEGAPEVVVQVRRAGTGQFLLVKILSFASGEPTVLFDDEFYKGALDYVDEGFEAAQPLYLYNEANCCPCRVERVTYGWDGERFKGLERSREAIEGGESCPAFPQPATWQQVEGSNEGPSPRRDAALVADTTRNRVILFGGRSGSTAFNDTWAFDLKTQSWQLLGSSEAPRPPARFSMVAGVDSMRERLIITTGQAADGSVFDDVWSFDLTNDTWQQIEASGEAPAPRYGAAGGIFDYSDALYLTHGFADTRYNDTWAFDLERNSWSNVTPEGDLPLNRCLHGAAMTGPGSLALFGGCSSGFGPCPQEDSWVLDPTTTQWRQISETGPSARTFPGMVSLADRSEVLLFGGGGAEQADLNDVWILDSVLEQWREVNPEGTPPTARDGHSMTRVMTFDIGSAPSSGSHILVFGGESNGEVLNDLWMLIPGDE
ncbi:MAG: hypothetical protein H0T73_08825 [Ardenticatenales bacterium]|nr:hypothetical protein [Ardenticatenales bacterium]